MRGARFGWSRWLWLAGLAPWLVGAGCLDPWNVEDTTYPCRGEADCVEGFECDPLRYICVKQGTASRIDAGTPDAGSPDLDAGSPDANDAGA